MVCEIKYFVLIFSISWREESCLLALLQKLGLEDKVDIPSHAKLCLAHIEKSDFYVKGGVRKLKLDIFPHDVSILIFYLMALFLQMTHLKILHIIIITA